MGYDHVNPNRYAVASNKSATDSAAWKALSQFFTESPGQAIVNGFTGESSGKPIMLRMKDIADSGVAAASVVITAAGGFLGLYEDSIVGKTAQLSGIGAAVGGALKPWLDMIIFVSQITVGFFLMCSIYLPLIPFIIFMGQVLNWLITVVEGVAAAPFLAFAHLDTDGEGLGHKTQYGYTFMLSSFMRPVMLVLGFVFACIILEVIGGFMTNIYADVIRNAQIDSMTGLFSIYGYIAIFLVTMVILTNSSMSVTYLSPDAIFQFIGAHSSATAQVGRHEGDKMAGAMGGGTAVTRVAQPASGMDKMRGANNWAKRQEQQNSQGGGVRGAGNPGRQS